MSAPPQAFFGSRPTPPRPQAQAQPRNITNDVGGWSSWLNSAAPGWQGGVAAAAKSAMTPFYKGGAGAGIMTNPYTALIGGDYGVQDMESRMNATLGRYRSDFTGQLRQALIDLGITDKSKLTGGLGNYIDAATIQKAAENKYSQQAKISQQETARRAQSEASLAARGMLGSGQLTTENERTVAEGERSRYEALRDFLSGGQQGLRQIADIQDQLAGQLAEARFAAAQRAAEMQMYSNLWDQQYGQPQGLDFGAMGGQPLTPLFQNFGGYSTPSYSYGPGMRSAAPAPRYAGPPNALRTVKSGR